MGPTVPWQDPGKLLSYCGRRAESRIAMGVSGTPTTLGIRLNYCLEPADTASMTQ